MLRDFAVEQGANMLIMLVELKKCSEFSALALVHSLNSLILIIWVEEYCLLIFKVDGKSDACWLSFCELISSISPVSLGPTDISIGSKLVHLISRLGVLRLRITIR